jgi:hypothetical protein
MGQPNANVTVPVQPNLSPSHALPAPVAVPAPAPVLAPAPLAPVLPAVGLAIGPTPITLIPFVSYINGHFKLFVYDRSIADNYALPGAGEDIQNPQLFSNSRIVFDREGHRGRSQIYFYDVVAELLVSFNDVNGLGDVKDKFPDACHTFQRLFQANDPTARLRDRKDGRPDRVRGAFIHRSVGSHGFDRSIDQFFEIEKRADR